MPKKRNYYTESKKSKIAIAAIEGKLPQAQLTSESVLIPRKLKPGNKQHYRQLKMRSLMQEPRISMISRNLSMHCMKKLVDCKRSYPG